MTEVGIFAWPCAECGAEIRLNREAAVKFEQAKQIAEASGRSMPNRFVCHGCVSDADADYGLREWAALQRRFPWLTTAAQAEISTAFKACHPAVPWDRLAQEEAPERQTASAGVEEIFTGATFATCGDLPSSVVDPMRAFAQDPQGLALLTGVPGAGKTTLAAAVVAESLAVRGVGSVRFVSERDYLDSIRRGFDDSRGGISTSLLPADHPRNVALLVLDDLGASRLTDWGAGELAGLIEHRHAAGLPMLITSNLSLGEIGSRIDGRVASRLVEGGTLHKLPDVDLRARHAN